MSADDYLPEIERTQVLMKREMSELMREWARQPVRGRTREQMCDWASKWESARLNVHFQGEENR